MRILPDWRLFGDRKLLTEEDFLHVRGHRPAEGLEMQPLQKTHWFGAMISEAKAALDKQLEEHIRTMQAAFGENLGDYRLLLGKVKPESVCRLGSFEPQGFHFTQAVRVVHVSQLEQAMRAFGEEHTVYGVKEP